MKRLFKFVLPLLMTMSLTGCDFIDSLFEVENVDAFSNEVSYEEFTSKFIDDLNIYDELYGMASDYVITGKSKNTSEVYTYASRSGGAQSSLASSTKNSTSSSLNFSYDYENDIVKSAHSRKTSYSSSTRYGTKESRNESNSQQTQSQPEDFPGEINKYAYYDLKAKTYRAKEEHYDDFAFIYPAGELVVRHSQYATALNEGDTAECERYKFYIDDNQLTIVYKIDLKEDILSGSDVIGEQYTNSEIRCQAKFIVSDGKITKISGKYLKTERTKYIYYSTYSSTGERQETNTNSHVYYVMTSTMQNVDTKRLDINNFSRTGY